MNLHTLKRQRLPEYERYFLSVFSQNVWMVTDTGLVEYYDSEYDILMGFRGSIIYINFKFVNFKCLHYIKVDQIFKTLINKYLNIKTDDYQLIVMSASQKTFLKYTKSVNLMEC